MRWFIFLTILKIIYYLFVGICVIINASALINYIPLPAIFFVSVVFQLALLTALFKAIKCMMDIWIIFTFIEVIGVLATLVYVESTPHYWLYFPLYLISQIYSICRVFSFRGDHLNSNSEYEILSPS